MTDEMNETVDWRPSWSAPDIVERLRKEASGVTVNLNPWPTMREAADVIEELRANNAALQKIANGYADEIERLEHMKANLHSHIKRLEDENSELIKEIKHLQELAYYANDTAEANIKRADEAEADNAKLREALEKIAKYDIMGECHCIARAALAQRD